MTAPRLIKDPQTGINMVDFDFSDRLNIDSPVSMPMTIFMVGRESGMSLPNREFLVRRDGDWQTAEIGAFFPGILITLGIYSSSSSGILSLVEWSINRYDYSLRINGSTIDTSSSANWRPDSLFDRINGNGTLFGRRSFYVTAFFILS